MFFKNSPFAFSRSQSHSFGTTCK